MSELSLHKTEKLCSRTAVNRLFAEGKPAKAYPLRAVYNESNRTYGAAAQFMITIPKKKSAKPWDACFCAAVCARHTVSTATC